MSRSTTRSPISSRIATVRCLRSMALASLLIAPRVSAQSVVASRERGALAEPAAAPRPANRDSASTAAKAARATIATSLGVGSVSVGGEIQMGYVDGWAVSEHAFRIRRINLRLLGALSPRLSWTLQADAAKALGLRSRSATVNGERVLVDESVNQGSRTLQDAYLTYSWRPWLTAVAGQSVLPFTFEGSAAPATYESIDQAMFISDRARGGGVAAVRDVGLALGSAPGTRWFYRVGLYNSSGDQQNTTDANSQKSVVGRVTAAPWPWLRVGASGVYGGTPTAERARRDRAAVELHLRLHTLAVRVEAVDVRDSVSRSGGYAQLMWKLPAKSELLARWDSWDPDRHDDTRAASVRAQEATVGASRQLEQNAVKVQVNVARRWYAQPLLPVRTSLGAQVQVAW